MSDNYSGRCACGKFSYACNTGVSKFTLICQCRQCQRITGTGHSAQFVVEKSQAKLVGKTSTFELTSDAGNKITSHFCGNCGSPLYKTTSMMSDTLFFHVATLDEPAQFEPQTVVCGEFGQPWDHIDPAIPRRE